MTSDGAFICSPALLFRRHRDTNRITPRRPKMPSACESSPRLPAGSGFSKPAKNQKIAFVGAETLGISFVCNANNCNTRITKKIKRRSYEKGTILIQCPSCEKHHVIADNMGLYKSITGGKKNVEQIAEGAGQKVTRVDSTVFDLEKLVSEVIDEEQGGQLES